VQARRSVRSTQTGAPRLRVRVSAPAGAAQAFRPLAPPRDASVWLEGSAAELLDRLSLRCTLELVPGTHRIALFAGDVLPVEVAQGGCCRASATAGRRGAAQALVEKAEFVFEPALAVHDIVPVLARLPTLFEDRQLAPIAAALSRAAGLRGGTVAQLLRRIADVVPMDIGTPELRERIVAEVRRLGGRLRGGAGDLASVRLERAVGEPVRRGGTWLLELRFSGEFVLAGQVPVPFRDVRLPHPVVPAAHADLARLSAAEPLATARLRTEGLRAEVLADQLAALLWSASGTVECEGVLPALSLDALMPDRGMLDLDAAVPGPVRASARFSTRIGREDASVFVEEAALEAGGRRLAAEATLRLHAKGRGIAAALLEAVQGRRFRGTKLDAELELRLPAGSELPDSVLRATVRHAELTGGIDLDAGLESAGAEGKLRAVLEDGALRTEGELGFHATVRLRPGGGFDDNLVRVVPEEACLTTGGSLRLDPGRAEIRLNGTADARLACALRVAALPELDVDDGDWRAEVPAKVAFEACARATTGEGALPELDFSGTGARVVLGAVRAELGGRTLRIPDGAVVDATLREGVIAASGLGRALADLAWDLRGRLPVLSHGAQEVEILVPSLARRAVTVALSPAGGLSFRGDTGDLFDAALFNALVHPGADPQRIAAVLDDDATKDRLLGPVRVFSREAHDIAVALRRFAKRAHRALEDEGIGSPGDAIPGPKLARIASRLLAGGPEWEERILPLVRSVTEGRGLDVRATKRLVNDALGDHEWQYELDRCVRLVARLLAPAPALREWKASEAPPFERMPEHAARLRDLPSAHELYEAMCSTAPLPEGFSHAVAPTAPYLELEQLEHLLAARRGDWQGADLACLRHVREIKRRVRDIAESYGGFAFAPQSHAIAFFLGEALAMCAPSSDERLPASGSLLGPDDAATLLQACLASVVRGRTVQRNQRLLLAHVLARPPEFLREVLWELGQGNARVLAGALNALLNSDQFFLREPLDLAHEFGERLGFGVPRLADYLAGGRFARRSYFEELNRCAERILLESEPYLALRCHLRIDRGDPPAAPLHIPMLEQTAIDAIAAADAEGAHWDRGGDEAGRRRAVEAYEAAFEACRAVLAQDPRAFQRPWMRAFWARNHEALVVHGVVRGVQEGLDRDRRWLEVRSGRAVPQDERELVEAVIGVLYFHEADRLALGGDPLVRLLIDPAPGAYDFTIVTAMGVVTEGARGHELETACERLEKRRGIRTERADTATMRSLEFNAARIEEAVRRTSGPWGWVGYSQGCANGFFAESRLLGGTPGQQELARRLVARNLLFSAFNGSAHGTCSDWKYLQAVTEGERILKHYQAVLSRRAVEMGLSALRLSLDSRLAVASMLGSASLSHDGPLFLQREGVFRDDVPTSLVRGIVEEDATLPEALEWLAHVLTKQTGSAAHDTQVMADEAHGHPLRVRSATADALERCDMGCMVQRTHHWSPLVKETEFVTTARDRERAIYDSPKDRHLVPWIEVNARFGRIRRRT